MRIVSESWHCSINFTYLVMVIVKLTACFISVTFSNPRVHSVNLLKFQQETISIGGSRGALPAPPPTGSISFIFAYVFAKKCMRQRLAPPPPTGRRPPPPQREILDPPLIRDDVRTFHEMF